MNEIIQTEALYPEPQACAIAWPRRGLGIRFLLDSEGGPFGVGCPNPHCRPSADAQCWADDLAAPPWPRYEG